MLRDNSQLKLSLSPYQGIYEVIIPANHLLRRIKENVDFTKAYIDTFKNATELEEGMEVYPHLTDEVIDRIQNRKFIE